MKFIKMVFTITAMSIAAISAAEARINTVNLYCDQAQDLVYSRGGIVLSTGRNTFDRFVADRSFCPGGDYVKRAYVRTRDRRSCRIGYTCTADSPYENYKN